RDQYCAPAWIFRPDREGCGHVFGHETRNWTARLSQFRFRSGVAASGFAGTVRRQPIERGLPAPGPRYLRGRASGAHRAPAPTCLAAAHAQGTAIVIAIPLAWLARDALVASTPVAEASTCASERLQRLVRDHLAAVWRTARDLGVAPCDLDDV